MLKTIGSSDAMTAEICSAWMQRLRQFKQKAALSTNAQLESSYPTWGAATAPTAPSSPFSGPYCFRGHYFTFLRYLKAMQIMQRYNPYLYSYLHEVRCQINTKRAVIAAVRWPCDWEAWFQSQFMAQVSEWHRHNYGRIGSLLSLMTEPIGSDSTQLFSAVVRGIGCKNVSMFALGRMEWLAMELVVAARQVLMSVRDDENDKFWKAIEQYLDRKRSALLLTIAFAPHKMRKVGDELETDAAGAGERADVLLLAWPRDTNIPSVLGSAYHTTNVPTGTATMKMGQVYPESRILWRYHAALPDLMKVAANKLARDLGVPSAAASEVLLNSDRLLDQADWRSEIMPLQPNPADIVEDTDDSSDILRGFLEAEATICAQ